MLHDEVKNPIPLSKPANFSKLAHCAGSRRFAIIPIEWLSRISRLNSLRVYLVLASYTSKDSEDCWPSVKLIGAESGIEVRAVKHSLRDLEAIGALKTELRPNQSSRYRLLPPPSLWTKEPDPTDREALATFESWLCELATQGMRVSCSLRVRVSGQCAEPTAKIIGANPLQRAVLNNRLTYFRDRLPRSVFSSTIRAASKRRARIPESTAAPMSPRVDRATRAGRGVPRDGGGLDHPNRPA